MKLRYVAVAALPFALSGCGIPPAVVIAKYAIDGVSYVVSGKSVADHAISVAAAEDCALFRVVQGSEVCFEEDGATDETIMMAATGRDTFEGDAALAADPMALPASLASVAAAMGPAVTVEPGAASSALGIAAVEADADWSAAWSGGLEQAAFAPASSSWSPPPSHSERLVASVDAALGFEMPPPAPAIVAPFAAATSEIFDDPTAPAVTPRIVTVIGSFRTWLRAARHRASFAALGTEVAPTTVRGDRWYRVVTTAPLEDAVAAGAADAWRINLCAEPGAAALCVEPLTVAGLIDGTPTLQF